jgi:hypothetical protein
MRQRKSDEGARKNGLSLKEAGGWTGSGRQGVDQSTANLIERKLLLKEVEVTIDVGCWS